MLFFKNVALDKCLCLLHVVCVLADDVDEPLRHPGHGHLLDGGIFLHILAQACCKHGAWDKVGGGDSWVGLDTDCQDFPYRGSLLLVMGDCMYPSVSHALRISAL